MMNIIYDERGLGLLRHQGRQIILRPSFRVLLELELVSGKKLIELLPLLFSVTVGVSHIRSFCSLMVAKDEDRAFLDGLSFDAGYAQLLALFLVQAMNGGKTAKVPEKPSTSEKDSSKTDAAEGRDYPFKTYMGLAAAYLGWTPADFWQATPWELNAALDGYLEKIGARARNPMTRDNLKSLLKKHGGKSRSIVPGKDAKASPSQQAASTSVA